MLPWPRAFETSSQEAASRRQMGRDVLAGNEHPCFMCHPLWSYGRGYSDCFDFIALPSYQKFMMKPCFDLVMSKERSLEVVSGVLKTPETWKSWDKGTLEWARDTGSSVLSGNCATTPTSLGNYAHIDFPNGPDGEVQSLKLKAQTNASQDAHLFFGTIYTVPNGLQSLGLELVIDAFEGTKSTLRWGIQGEEIAEFRGRILEHGQWTSLWVPWLWKFSACCCDFFWFFFGWNNGHFASVQLFRRPNFCYLRPIFIDVPGGHQEFRRGPSGSWWVWKRISGHRSGHHWDLWPDAWKDLCRFPGS